MFVLHNEVKIERILAHGLGGLHIGVDSLQAPHLIDPVGDPGLSPNRIYWLPKCKILHYFMSRMGALATLFAVNKKLFAARKMRTSWPT